MNQRTRTALALVALLFAAGGAYAYLENLNPSEPDPVGTATTTRATTTATAPVEPAGPEPSSSEHGYGTAVLALNEAGSFPDGLSIRPLSVLEDSRCPSGVTCIQAGTVRISVRIRSGSGISTHTFEPGTTMTTEAQSITLVSVAPARQRDIELTETDYRFTFTVEKRATWGNTGACYVGGCSGQLCTDEPNVASTCEYRPQYACYKNATCERQADGKCGWTQTKELKNCLEHPPNVD